MRFLLLFIAFLSIPFYSLTQNNYEVTHYTVEDGLMSNLIDGIHEDSLGRIWILNGRGFAILNGDDAINLKGKEQIEVEGSIRKIDNKYYWGNTIFDTESIEVIRHGLQNNSVVEMEIEQSIFVMSTTYDPTLGPLGNYWVYNNEGEPYFYYYNRRDTVDLLPLLDSLQSSFNDTTIFVKNFIIDNQSRVWFRTADHKLHSYDPNEKRLNTLSQKLPYANSIYFQNDSVYAVGCYRQGTKENGVYLIKKGHKKFFPGVGASYVQLYQGNQVYFSDQEGLKIVTGDSISTVLKGKFISEFGDLYGEIIPTDDHIFIGTQRNNKSIIYKYDRFSMELDSIHEDAAINNLLVSRFNQIWYSNDEGVTCLGPSNYEKNDYNKLNNRECYVFLKNENGEEYLSCQSKIKESEIVNSLPIDIIFIDSLNETSLIATGYFPALYQMRWGKNYHTSGINETYSLLLNMERDVFKMNEDGSVEEYNNRRWICQLENGHLDTIISQSSLNRILSRTISIKSIVDFQNKIYVFCREGVVEILDRDSINWYSIPKEYYDWPFRSYQHKLNPENQIIKFAQDSANKLVTLAFNFETNRFISLYNNVSAKDQYQLKDQLKYIELGDKKIASLGRKSIHAYLNGQSITRFEAKDFNKVKLYLEYDDAVQIDSNLIVACRINGLLKLNLYTGEHKFFDELLPYSKMYPSADYKALWLLSNEDLIVLDADSLLVNKVEVKEVWDQSKGYFYGQLVFKDNSPRIFNPFRYIEKRPDSLINKIKPRIHFSSIRVFYENFNWSTIEARVDSFSGNIVPYNMILKYNQNHLTFDYQGVSHSNKKPLIYFHQLVGQDTNFVGTTAKSATYSNLEPGDYTFKVFAQDENDSHSRIIECSFSISPPYWETWWFISLCILAIGSSVYSGYQYNIRRLKARQVELETEISIATQEIRQQKNEIEEAHQEITDSIAYAKRIQAAILPPVKLVKEYLNDSFVLYKPKDVVAGDFYWMVPEAGITYFAAADCTGHGVPGAMVSVVCNNALNRSVKEFQLREPAAILDKTRELVIQEFEKSEEAVQDGMDIALCSLYGKQLKYAGAHNPLWIIRKGKFELEAFPEGSRVAASEDGMYELIEIKADKQPIGKYDISKKYTNHQFELKSGDSIYLFSDGYVDQFGGERGKKFKSLNFKRLLLSIQNHKMEEQKALIDDAFENWKKGLEQIDDVCVMGVRV